MKTPVKATLIAVAVAAWLLVVGIVYALSQQPAQPDPEAGEKLPTVRTDSHVLDEGGPDA
ncbi:disulfide bond formation protein DsbA, partial [Methylobacterium radiotolerans]